MLQCVTPQDVRRVTRAMVEAAIGGDVFAAKVLFTWLLGAPIQMDVTEAAEEIRIIRTPLPGPGGVR